MYGFLSVPQVRAGGQIKKQQTFIFWNSTEEFRSVAVVGIGDKEAKCNELEEINEEKENIRAAVAAGVKTLISYGSASIKIDDMGDAQAAAEGATLANYTFDVYRKKKDDHPHPPKIFLEGEGDCDWQLGVTYADAQNFARQLMETPANLLTPTLFANEAKKVLEPLGVKVDIHDEDWARSLKMNSFLSVARGSTEPPVFVEATYDRGPPGSKPLVLVGKGVTFDSGGISIKPSKGMDLMRADMGGAATVLSTLKAVAELKLPINIKLLIPLTENMPSGTATKPGDIVYAMNGKSICVNNTDAEGRLILADALCYSEHFSPRCVVDVATLTGAIAVALADGAAGVFTNSMKLWQRLHGAGITTGDRLWRMPLWQCYTEMMVSRKAYDIDNISKTPYGGSCTAAAFLKEFVPAGVDWAHIDIAGMISDSASSVKYLPGISGRPTRTLIEFVRQMAYERKDDC